MGIKESFDSALTLFQRGKPKPESDAERLKRLSVIRGFVIVEFVLAMLASITVPVAVMALGAGAVEVISTAWYFVIAPAVVSGVALLIYHARSIERPWTSTLGELCFWLTFPAGATLFLFAVKWQLAAAV